MGSILRLWLVACLLIAGYVSGVTAAKEVATWTNEKLSAIQSTLQ